MTGGHGRAERFKPACRPPETGLMRFVAIVVVMAAVAWLASTQLRGGQSGAQAPQQVVNSARGALGSAQSTFQQTQDARSAGADQP